MGFRTCGSFPGEIKVGKERNEDEVEAEAEAAQPAAGRVNFMMVPLPGSLSTEMRV